MAWLDDHRPARDQFREGRRETPSGVMVVHTAESTPDFVAFDGGAEAVANFIQGRSDPGSYHDLCDSDSCINLVDYANEAYQDGTGSNRHAWGGSIATRADVWPLAPQRWRDGAVEELAAAAARYAKWVKAHHGVTVPARRINRAQSEARMPGFISHAERDPARRSDPGAEFPWDQFLSAYARHMGTGGPLMALSDDQQRELYEAVCGDGRLKEVTLGVRQLLDARGPGYFAKPPEGAVVYYVDAGHQSKLELVVGGPLHEWLKALHRLNGLAERAVVVAVDVLDAIPTAELAPSVPPAG